MTSRRDQSYYDAHYAKDFSLKSITSHRGNRKIIRKLRDDKLQSLQIERQSRFGNDKGVFVVEEEDDDIIIDWGWLGYFTSSSRKLKHLCIRYLPTENEQRIDDFFEVLQHNKTIQSLQIEGVDLKPKPEKSLLYVGAFIMNNSSLSRLELTETEIDATVSGSLALFLGKSSQHNALKSLTLHWNDHREENGFGEEGIVDIVEGLKMHSQLEELSIRYNNVGTSGCIALGSQIDWEASNLKKLDLSFNRIDDEGMEALIAGPLTKCTNLKELDLSSSMMFMTDVGITSLSNYLQSDSCTITSLIFGWATYVEVLEALVPGLANCVSLKKMDFENSDVFSEEVCMSLASVFQSEKSNLECLKLFQTRICDDGVTALTAGLVGNNTLKRLGFHAEGIPEKSWSEFSTLLCDTSSIKNTYESNHTIRINIHGNLGLVPTNVVDHIVLNNSIDNSQEVAMCKILMHYPNIDMKPFINLFDGHHAGLEDDEELLDKQKLKMLPIVMSWFQRVEPCRIHLNETLQLFQSRKLSSMYQFVRELPMLFVGAQFATN
jgi:Leucine-rich repeat (LRR) protein